jgi:hypothetical protein
MTAEKQCLSGQRWLFVSCDEAVTFRKIIKLVTLAPDACRRSGEGFCDL